MNSKFGKGLKLEGLTSCATAFGWKTSDRVSFIYLLDYNILYCWNIFVLDVRREKSTSAERLFRFPGLSPTIGRWQRSELPSHTAKTHLRHSSVGIEAAVFCPQSHVN
jgi:hypothetical protein